MLARIVAENLEHDQNRATALADMGKGFEAVSDLHAALRLRTAAEDRLVRGQAASGSHASGIALKNSDAFFYYSQRRATRGSMRVARRADT